MNPLNRLDQLNPLSLWFPLDRLRLLRQSVLLYQLILLILWCL